MFLFFYLDDHLKTNDQDRLSEPVSRVRYVTTKMSIPLLWILCVCEYDRYKPHVDESFSLTNHHQN